MASQLDIESSLLRTVLRDSNKSDSEKLKRLEAYLAFLYYYPDPHTARGDIDCNWKLIISEKNRISRKALSDWNLRDALQRCQNLLSCIFGH